MKFKNNIKKIRKMVISSFLSMRIKAIKNRIKRKRKTGKKIRIIFLIQFPEMWCSEKSLYEKLMFNSKYETLILSIPKHKYNGKSVENGINNFKEINDAYRFLNDSGINSLNSLHNHRWLKISRLHPDIIFLQRPYESHLPKCYSFSRLAKKSIVCYIPYDGIDLSKTIHLPIMLNDALLRTCTYFFAPTKEQKDYFDKFKYSNLSQSITVGNPRFDLVKSCVCASKYKTFLWLPRWYFGNGNNNKSNFLKYVQPISLYFKNHQDLRLIIRPHPLMFDNIINEGLMSKKELDELLNNIKMISNIQFDANIDYIKTFEASDVLISDYTSLLLDYFVTGKPIIYCGETDCFNDIGSTISKTFYIADSQRNLIEMIENIINKKEEQRFKNARSKIVYQILNRQANACDLIIEYLDHI